MLTNKKFVERRYRFRAVMMKGDNAIPFSSGIPRYSVNVCDWYDMPLEPCPTCGHALSIVDHHCPYSSTASRAIPARGFGRKHLQQIIMAAVVLSVVVYLMFFR